MTSSGGSRDGVDGAVARRADGDTAAIGRRPLIVKPTQGRHYSLGQWHAEFKADGVETGSRYSISEWRLEPNAKGPGAHEHAAEHIFYVVEGVLSLLVGGEWTDCEQGTYALIPGGCYHDFENRQSVRCGFICVNVPGGFESELPPLVEWFEQNRQ